MLDGTARLLVLTGGEPVAGRQRREPARMARSGRGVPADRIRLENTSPNTRESLVNVEPILRREGVRSLILVTSPSHQRRAFLAARRALPGHPDRQPADPSSPGRRRAGGLRQRARTIVLREYAKLVYYGLRGWL